MQAHSAERNPALSRVWNGNGLRGRSVGAPAPLPPDNEAATTAADGGKFVRQHQQSEWNHPEAEDGKEAENAAEGQKHADGDSEPPRLRHPDFTPEYRDLSRRHLVVLRYHPRLDLLGCSWASLHKSRGGAFGSATSAANYMRAPNGDCENALREKPRKMRNASLQSRKGFAIGSPTDMRASVPR
jgi:hypothetical protein